MTVDLELVRFAIVLKGAFGVLLVDGAPCGPITLERTYPVDPTLPWGEQRLLIPSSPRPYRCLRTIFHRGGYETFEVTGVEGHSRLLFHYGNTEEDSDGCILVGLRYSPFAPGILDSRRGHELFMSILHGQGAFDLTVSEQGR